MCMQRADGDYNISQDICGDCAIQYCVGFIDARLVFVVVTVTSGVFL